MTEAYPLQWPDGWPRTPSYRRESDSRFGGSGRITVGRARDLLMDQLRLLPATDIIISSNVPTRSDGLLYADNKRIDDPGIAAYFNFKKRPRVMAMDDYVSVAGNLRSLGLSIEGMRQMQRHGNAEMWERAFTGFLAIAPPDWKKPWREVFGIKPNGPITLATVTELYRQKARERHPDAGGSDTLMAELNVAYEEAQRELEQ